MLFTVRSSFLFSLLIAASAPTSSVVVRFPVGRPPPALPAPPELAAPSAFVPRCLLPGTATPGLAGYWRGELACGFARPVVLPVLTPGAVLGFWPGALATPLVSLGLVWLISPELTPVPCGAPRDPIPVVPT